VKASEPELSEAAEPPEPPLPASLTPEFPDAPVAGPDVVVSPDAAIVDVVPDDVVVVVPGDVVVVVDDPDVEVVVGVVVDVVVDVVGVEVEDVVVVDDVDVVEDVVVVVPPVTSNGIEKPCGPLRNAPLKSCPTHRTQKFVLSHVMAEAPALRARIVYEALKVPVGSVLI